MIGSLAFDHLGLFGLPVHHITAPPALGAVLVLAGAILVRYCARALAVNRVTAHNLPSFC